MICVAFEEFVSVDIDEEVVVGLWGLIVNHFIAKTPSPGMGYKFHRAAAPYDDPSYLLSSSDRRMSLSREGPSPATRTPGINVTSLPISFDRGYSTQ
jgi:hypothetical protein